MRRPSRTFTVATAAVCAAVQIAGCATQPAAQGEPPSSAPSNAAMTVGVAAVLGAVLGAAVSSRGDRGKGAAIGALAGAALGGIIASYQDRQTASRSQASQQYRHKPANGDRLELEGATLAPAIVSAGTQVESSVNYTALAASADGPVNLREIRTLVAPDNSVVQIGDRQVSRAQGSHSSSIRFTMPNDFPRGNYRLVTTVTDGRQSKSIERALQVV